jgi:hypothetical protein
MYDMALEEFDKEPLSEREKGLVRMKSLTNYVMGLMIIVAGLFFLIPIEATLNFHKRYDADMLKMMAIVCFIYGAFRIFRGYQKNYFRER